MAPPQSAGKISGKASSVFLHGFPIGDRSLVKRNRMRHLCPIGPTEECGLTVANLITFVRFLMVPTVVYALMEGHTVLALAAFVIAGISDGVDGFVARQFNQRSELGAYLDPLADKLLLVCVFVVLGLMTELPLWLVVLAVSRDLLIVCAVLLSSVMGNPVKMHPLLVSKANTAVQIVLAACVLAELALEIRFGASRQWLVGLSAVLTAASTAAYFVAWLKHMSGYAGSEGR